MEVVKRKDMIAAFPTDGANVLVQNQVGKMETLDLPLHLTISQSDGSSSRTGPEESSFRNGLEGAPFRNWTL